ncbi:MAG: hypothetical protein CL565_01895 [Alphaproteobacteria bacterium]|nr:hypothetical protein [Alphaproteobacteria bacterium]
MLKTKRLWAVGLGATLSASFLSSTFPATAANDPFPQTTYEASPNPTVQEIDQEVDQSPEVYQDDYERIIRSEDIIPQFFLNLEPQSEAFPDVIRTSNLERKRYDAIVDPVYGRIIGDINQDELHDEIDPASLTKIMTFFLVEECIKRGRTFDGEELGRQTITSSGLSVDQLLFQLMRRSNNYAARRLAVHMAGGIEPFVREMNSRARELGMQNTRFINPSGLPGDQDYDGRATRASNQSYTTINDLSVLVTQLYRNGIDYQRYTDIDVDSNLRSTNPLYRPENLSFSQEFNVTGLKTGTTNRGRSFIGVAEYEGRTVFVITMGHMWKNSNGAKVGDSTRPRSAQSLIRTAYSLLGREREVVSERLLHVETEQQAQIPEQLQHQLPSVY